MDPNDTQIEDPLHFLAVCMQPRSYATSLVSLFNLVVSSSLGFKTIRPKGSVSSSCQCRTITHNKHTTFFSVPSQLAVLPLCESELKHTSCMGCVAWY